MRVVARVGRWVTVAAFLAAAATVLTLAALQVQGKQLLTVMSGSMTPAFVAGDVVIIEHVGQQDLAPGMIVSFHPPGSPHLTTHRILSIQPKPYGLFVQTKGDANATPDPDFTAAADVAGVVTSTVPLVGRWLAFYQSSQGRLLVLGTPMLLLVIGQAIASLGDLKRARRRRARPVGSGGAAGPQTSVAPSRSTSRVPGFSTATTSVLAIGIVVAAGAGGVVVGHHTNAAYTADVAISSKLSTASSWCSDSAYSDGVNRDSPDIYYRLDETTGTIATDSSANARNGDFVGAKTFGSPGALCRVSGSTAVTFDGSTGYLNNNHAYSLATDSAIEAWIKTTSTSGGVIAALVSDKGTKATQRILYMTPTGQLVIGGRTVNGNGNGNGNNGNGNGNNGNGTEDSYTSPASYNDGTWHHVVGVGGSTALTLYVDGIAVGSASTAQTAVRSGRWQVANDATRGWSTEPAHTLWNGSLDEVAIYNGGLSAARISAHYSAWR